MPTQRSTSRADQAAIFVDYENLHHVINAQHASNRYPDEYAAEILNELQNYLEGSNGARTSVGRAYADFGALDGDGQFIQRSLHQGGFDPRFVSGAHQKNASELELCIDAVDLLKDRSDLTTVVIVSGNRLYLPLVRRIRSMGRRVIVAPLFPPSAEDTPTFLHEDVIFDARNLLSSSSRDALLDGDYAQGSSDEDVPYRQRKPQPDEYLRLDDPMALRTIAITEEHFGQYDEVYLTPLLRKLSDILGPEHDPKSLISELEEAGAVRLEKRNGYPYDYTVLIVHNDHPDVQEVQENYYEHLGYGNGHSDGQYDDYDEYEEYDEYAEAPAEEGTAEADADTPYDDVDEDSHDEWSEERA
jgi:uncharacterized LabA/DUF88 family protein